MEEGFYKLPLNIGKFFSGSGGHLERCSELESIDQHIGLLLVTHRGEHGFDQQYGTKLWELDFENIVSKAAWEDMFVKFVHQAVTTHEKRIKDVEVKIDVRDMVREEISTSGLSVRKRVDIIIQATVISTNKRQGFKHIIYLGPLSRD